MKMQSFCRDRLGTNIGKAHYKKEYRFLAAAPAPRRGGSP